MKYQIHPCGDGRFEIQRLEIVTVGVMYDQALANMVLAMMSSIAGEPEAPSDAGDISLPELLAPALPQSMGKTGLPRICGEFVPLSAEPVPVPDAVTAREPEKVPADQHETPLQEAFRRLEAGEKLGRVADDVGIPMPQLRGQWARQQRGTKPDVAATAPHTELESCRLCERDFRPSATSDGLCSRCARDAGLV